MIQWLKDLLGINRYVVERKRVFDQDFTPLGSRSLSYRQAVRLRHELFFTRSGINELYRIMPYKRKGPGDGGL